MKIRCPQCSFENLKESGFCQECGYGLESLTKKTRVEASIHEEIEKIDDVIFEPKKSVLKKIIFSILILGAVGFGGLVLLIMFSGKGSDTTIQTEPETFPVSYLNITDYDVIFGDYGESYFVGTLKNAYSKAARNVKVRLDFYFDEALKRNFDTRNTIIENVVEANGAYSFKVPLNFYSKEKFWWIWKIESASY